MKVLHLITSLNRGGAENHLTCLIRGQLNNKKKIYVIFLKGDGYWENYLKSLGVIVIKLNQHNFITQILNIKKIIKTNKIDILHSHLPHMEILGFLSLIGNNVTKFIITKHVDNDYLGGSETKKNSIISSIASFVIYSKAKKIIAISYSVKKFLMKNQLLNLPLMKNKLNNFKNKIKVVYYGLDDFYITKCLSNGKKLLINPKPKVTFCFIGRLAKQKQIDKVILSFSKFYEKHKKEENNFKLMIVGSGPEKEKLVTLSRKLNIHNQIIWENFTDNVGSVLNEIDIFCINSSFEGLGLVMLEAMAYSKPIIGPNTSAIPEVVKNNVNGLLVNPGDINGYSNAMDKLINDHIRKTLSKNSYKILREQFNFKTMIDKINSTYNSEQT